MIYPQLNLMYEQLEELLHAYMKQRDDYFLCNFITKNRHGLHLSTTIDIHGALKRACGETPLETIIDEMNDLTKPQREALYRMNRQLRIDWLNHELKRTAPCS